VSVPGRKTRSTAKAGLQRPLASVPQIATATAPVDASRSDALVSAQLRSPVRRAAITAAERREVFGATSFRIVARFQKPPVGGGGHSRFVHSGNLIEAEAR
jgi:hypothetical protein